MQKYPLAFSLMTIINETLKSDVTFGMELDHKHTYASGIKFYVSKYKYPKQCKILKLHSKI
jgi:hypothetical protein